MKTGLVLGGGGSRGAYEIGVWQALRELGIGIDVVTGTSVGAINGALVCQGSFDLAVDLWRELETHMVFDVGEEKKISDHFDFNFNIAGMPVDQLNAYAKEILTRGGADVTGLKKMLNQHLEEENIRQSPVEYGLVAVEYPAMIPYNLKKQDIPAGQMSDFILASAACFPAVKTVEIGDKKFIDGGYSDNLPIQLAMDLGAKRIIAVDLDAIGIKKIPKDVAAQHITVISSSWDLGNFLVFDKVNSRRILRLGYLDTMKQFQVFDGHSFSFSRGDFPKKDIPGADAAAEIFQLDPEIIYTRDILNHRLRQSIEAHRSSNPKGQSNKKTLLDRIKEDLLKIQRDLDSRSIVLHLASDLIQNPESPGLTLARGAKKILRKELEASEYLATYLKGELSNATS
jgi:NTE family protein